jgi:hypothetical protein
MLEYLWIPATLVLHEYGHYVLARREGIYNGWGILPTPHIKMSRPSRHRSFYLSGLAFSLPAGIPFVAFSHDQLWLFPACVVGISALDLVCVWILWENPWGLKGFLIDKLEDFPIK